MSSSGSSSATGASASEDMIDDLEVIPRKVVEYRGSHFEEMDLDAVLARHPQVVLVDELAHTNVPGSGRNEKRWQDVMDLLDADIDVITTVNIQHLESIADAVERIIEVQIRERVPDWVLRKADQIELVDSSPEQLRRRMAHGNIYPPEQIHQALSHYFRTDNLTALRELALRFLADETEEQLLDYLRRPAEGRRVGDPRAHPGRGDDGPGHRRHRAPGVADGHPDQGRSPGAPRRGHREGPSRSPDDQLIALRQLAADVGAEWSEIRSDDPAQALIDFARKHHVTQIVVGSSHRSRWQELMGGGSIVRKIARLAAPAAIDVHIIARRGEAPEFADTAEAADES